MRAVAIYILVPTSAFTVAPLVARKVERLVGIYVLAVHALDLSEIVAPSSMPFAGGLWKIHFTCGSPYILIPTFYRSMLSFAGEKPAFGSQG